MYFRSASGKLVEYNGDRSKEDIINFIETNRDKTAEDTKPKDTESKPKESKQDSEAKDEL